MFLGPYEEAATSATRASPACAGFSTESWSSVIDAQGVATTSRRSRIRRSCASCTRRSRKYLSDLPALSYNTAVAAMMEYMNVVRARRARRCTGRKLSARVQLVAPFAPHVAEDLWERLGHDRVCSTQDGRRSTLHLAAEQLITIAVQVGREDARHGPTTAGRRSGRDGHAAALADANISKFVAGPPKKVIFVPGRLLIASSSAGC